MIANSISIHDLTNFMLIGRLSKKPSLSVLFILPRLPLTRKESGFKCSICPESWAFEGKKLRFYPHNNLRFDTVVIICEYYASSIGLIDSLSLSQVPLLEYSHWHHPTSAQQPLSDVLFVRSESQLLF